MMPKVLFLSDRLYNILLLAYPASFRRAYGFHLAQVFRDDCRETLQQAGPEGLLFLWLNVLFDLAKSALTEHIWEIFHMPSEKVVRNSGLAAIVAGLLWTILFPAGWFNFDAKPLLGMLLFVVVMLLFGLGLAGLYKRCPNQLLVRLSFGLSYVGIVWSLIGGLLVVTTDSWWYLFISGFFVFALGLTLVGIATLTTRTLSPWGILPIAVAVLLLGFILSGDDPSPPLQVLLGVLYGMGWMLLGFILWWTEPHIPNTAISA